MNEIGDSRLQELKRLHVAMDAAQQYLEEFEIQLSKCCCAEGQPKVKANPDCNFARHVAAGLQKVRQNTKKYRVESGSGSEHFC